MKPGINNYSEIGKLNKVLLHRLGNEIEGLVPDNFERLLFDDIPYLKIAQQEHDRFAELLRENGVEVIYYADETAKALSTDEIRKAFVDDFVADSGIYSGRSAGSGKRLSPFHAIQKAGGKGDCRNQKRRSRSKK